MCLAKKKTKVVKKTLDPTFQQSLMFDESPQGKVLQVLQVKIAPAVLHKHTLQKTAY